MVAPHDRLGTERLWYVLGFDLTRQAPRSFRLDRISAPRTFPHGRFEPDHPRPLFPELRHGKETRLFGP